MNPPTARNSAEIEAVAANWIVRRDAGLSPAEAREFAQWQASDPRHADAVARKESAWAALSRPRGAGQSQIMLERLQQRGARRRRRRRSAAAAGALIVALGIFSFQRMTSSTPSATAAASQGLVVRPETRTLSDGTIVELRPGAEVLTHFSPVERRVTLTQGTAHFQITPDRARPFVVDAGKVQFRAVGTAFSVEKGSEQIEMLVTEGTVAVEEPAHVDAAPSETTVPPATAAALRTITQVEANYRFVVEASVAVSPSAAGPIPVSSDEMAQRLAWRAPRLEFSELPLADAVALMNRHNTVRFAIGDESLARLRISGVFRAGNFETFVRLLEGTCGIKAERFGDTIVLKKAGP